jgi:hypothetical protein
MFLKPPNSVVLAGERKPIKLDPNKPLAHKTPTEFDRLAQQARQILRRRQILYWSAVSGISVLTGLMLWRILR